MERENQTVAAVITRDQEAWVASSVFDLIEGILDRFPNQARLLLRRRIILSKEPTISERALIQVCAKRFEVCAALPDLHAFQVHQVEALLKTPEPAAYDRPIRSWLFDAEWNLLQKASNAQGTLKTRHAEINLLLPLRKEGRKIPRNSILVTSLKPCAMCSALIWEMAEDLHSLRVIYLENDPGPWGQNTILTEGSPTRTRFFQKSSPEFNLKLQFSAHELPRELLLALLASDREIHELGQKCGITNT